MSFDPFEEKTPRAIVKKICKGKSTAALQKLFSTVVEAKQSVTNLRTGGVSTQLGEECLALAEVVAVGRGNSTKISLPDAAEKWLAAGIEFDDGLAELAQKAVDKVRTQSDNWAIVEDMGGWPAWTNYCRGLSTRLKKPAKKRKAPAKIQGTAAVLKALRSKECRIEQQKGVVTEIRCWDDDQITDAELTEIAQLKSLQKLGLSNQAITDNGLRLLSNLKDLRQLWLSKCKNIKGHGFKGLRLPRLEDLSFGPGGANVVLANGKGLKGLRELNLNGSDLTDKGLQHLDFAAKLETFRVDKCSKLKGTGLATLRPLKKLRVLSASGTTLSPSGLEALSSLTQLQSLKLSGAKLPISKLTCLGHLSNLETLELMDAGLLNKHLGFLSNLRKLKKLDLSRNRKLTDEALTHIADLPALEFLGIASTSVTEDSVELLKSIKTLREVAVIYSQISRPVEIKLSRALKRKR